MKGTVGYMAPELIKNMRYDCKADIFSVGVIAYRLLTGNPLFEGRNFVTVKYNNQTCEGMRDKIYNDDSLSKSSQTFLEGCLQPNPSLRFSAKEALQHMWFKKEKKALK